MKFKALFLILFLQTAAWAAPYRSPEGFTFNPPAGWKDRADMARSIHAAATFIGPNQGKFNVNLSITVQPFGDLKKFTQISLDQIKSAKGRLLSRKAILFGKYPGQRIIWGAHMQDRDLMFNSSYLCANGKTYLFTGTSLAAKWSAAAPLLAKAADSMRATK